MKRLSGFLVSLLFAVTFIPSVVSASNVNTKLAENSSAVMAEIEKMNLPDLPDAVAENMRGEVAWLPIMAVWGIGTYLYVQYKFITDPEFVVRNSNLFDFYLTSGNTLITTGGNFMMIDRR